MDAFDNHFAYDAGAHRDDDTLELLRNPLKAVSRAPANSPAPRR